MVLRVRQVVTALMVGGVLLAASCGSPRSDAAATPTPTGSEMAGMTGMSDMPDMTMGSTMAMGSTMEMAGAASRLVDPSEFAAAIAEPDRVTIDVHIPFEGTITGTDLMIPYNQIQQDASQLPADKSTPLAIYCRSGNMSAIAAPVLRSLGYTDIVELRGGMDAWTAGGRPLNH